MAKKKDDKPEGYVFGRPAKYDPSFCAIVIEIGENGGWIADMACACKLPGAKHGVSYQTIFNWAKEHDDFLEALEIARAECRKWWENKAQSNIDSKVFQSALWKSIMQSRFREDYTDNHRLSGDSLNPIAHNIAIEFVKAKAAPPEEPPKED